MFLYSMRNTPLLSSAIYVTSQTSDQPPPTHDSSPTQSLELVGFNCDAQPPRKPRGPPRTSTLCHTHCEGVSEVASLHPNLAIVRCDESRLSNSGNGISNTFSFTVLMSRIEFQAIRSKIQANPKYLGEMLYIQLLNPQYRVKILVHCQRAIFRTILNLHFPKLASPILTVATPLNAKPPTPLYFYPFMLNHTKKNKERYRHWRRLWYNYARYPYGIYSQVNLTSALA